MALTLAVTWLVGLERLCCPVDAATIQHIKHTTHMLWLSRHAIVTLDIPKRLSLSRRGCELRATNAGVCQRYNFFVGRSSRFDCSHCSIAAHCSAHHPCTVDRRSPTGEKATKMKTAAKLNRKQLKAVKGVLWMASADLEFALEPVCNALLCFDAPKVNVLASLNKSGQRALYLTATDAAASFGIDLPEYAKAEGTAARKLVDAESLRFATRLYDATLVP